VIKRPERKQGRVPAHPRKKQRRIGNMDKRDTGNRSGCRGAPSIIRWREPVGIIEAGAPHTSQDDEVVDLALIFAPSTGGLNVPSVPSAGIKQAIRLSDRRRQT